MLRVLAKHTTPAATFEDSISFLSCVNYSLPVTGRHGTSEYGARLAYTRLCIHSLIARCAKLGRRLSHPLNLLGDFLHVLTDLVG